MNKILHPPCCFWDVNIFKLNMEYRRSTSIEVHSCSHWHTWHVFSSCIHHRHVQVYCPGMSEILTFCSVEMFACVWTRDENYSDLVNNILHWFHISPLADLWNIFVVILEVQIIYTHIKCLSHFTLITFCLKNASYLSINNVQWNCFVPVKLCPKYKICKL